MGWAETVRTAVEALNGRRLRSLLTMLGILIGIAAVMLTVGLGEGARRSIDAQINKLGSNLLIVMPGSASGGLASASSTLTLADADALADPVVAPDIAQVAPVASTRSTASFGSQSTTTTVTGTTPAFAPVRSRTLAEGRFFTGDEADGAQQVAVLGATAAAHLFKDTPPLGQRVTVGGGQFTVVGVMDAVGSSSLSNDDDAIVVPLATFGARLAPGSNALSVQAIYVNAKDGDSIAPAHQEITAALNARHATTASTQDFSIMTFQALMNAAGQMTGVLTTLLSGIAAIALLVGGIGVMNIMLVSVSERVREIGLRKALGATPAVIRRQFLVEAAILGLVGGLLGVALGFLGAAILTPLLDIPVTISWPATALALGVSLAIGIGAGVYPASRAAKLAPIDALRSE